MRAELSIIVPVLDAEAELPGLLSDLMEGVEAGLVRELILSDGGSRDGTARIAEAVGARWCSGPASRGGQLQRGAGMAGGAWLMFLHADPALPAGWSEIVRAQMEAGRPAHARLAFADGGVPGRIVAGCRTRAPK